MISLGGVDYQKSEDEFRYRVVDAHYDQVFIAVRKTLIDLGYPIDASDIKKGDIRAQSIAPTPLTQSEWSEVVKQEPPRVKEIGGWFVRISEDPSVYFIEVSVKLTPRKSSTFILLEYQLDAPKYRAMGITPNRRAPPLAVQLASAKFWNSLEKKLKDVNMPAPRTRRLDEREA